MYCTKSKSKKEKIEILEENLFLIEQIDQVLDSNLKGIDNFVDSLKQNGEIQAIISIQDGFFIKEEINIICKNRRSYLLINYTK